MTIVKSLLTQAFLLFFLFSASAADSVPSVMLTVTEHNGRMSVEAKPKEGLAIGKIPPTEKKAGTIRVENKTPFPVKLGGWRSPCECLDLDEPSWELAPGAKSESGAILDGSGYRGEFDKNMHISFSSKESETVNFFLPVKFAVVEDNEMSEPRPDTPPKEKSFLQTPDESKGSHLAKSGTILPEQLDMEAKDFNPNNEETVFIFAGRTCPGCNYMKRELGPRLLKKYGVDGGRVALLDLEKPENMLALAELEEQIGTRGTKTPVLYFRGTMMYGKAEVEKELESPKGNIAKSKTIILPKSKPVKQGAIADEVALNSVKRKTEGFTIGVIAVAGLIDGINPCAFAGLVFLASLLASSRMGGRSLLVLGGAYCLGSFVCYFLMGLGLLGIIKPLLGGGGLPRTLLNGGMSMVLCIFSYLSFRDAIIFKRKGTGSEMTLKLPDSFRKRIRELMHKGTSGRMLWAGAFGAGFVVTVIGSACTVQIYVPVLAFLAKMEGVFNIWIAYLLLYNIMFVAPLVGLLFAVYFGIGSLKLAALTRIDAFVGKILMGVLFAFLAVLMILL